MKDNKMWLWKAVERTNPKYTKQVGFGRKFTSINAQSQIMTATEQLGSMGYGWGVENERFEMVCDGLLGYQAKLWYKIGDTICSYDINSSINTHNKSGKLDDECYKKVSTDALTKGLSKLGFNADIFLGLWDDNRYVAQMEKEHAEKPVSMDRPHPRNAFKKKMEKGVIEAMLEYIENGDKAIVLQKMVDYNMTEEEKTILNNAIQAKRDGGANS
mgnify:CR=1 FL=1